MQMPNTFIKENYSTRSVSSIKLHIFSLKFSLLATTLFPSEGVWRPGPTALDHVWIRDKLYERAKTLPRRSLLASEEQTVKNDLADDFLPFYFKKRYGEKVRVRNGPDDYDFD